MRTVDLIERKRDGLPLPPEAVRELVRGITAGEVPDYQIAAFLMAVYFRGMRREELVALTDAMLHSGDTLALPSLANRFKVDKHSTGGVGDKVSLLLAPAVAACGLAIPMISGRGLGHTGGTLDKLEAIPGLRVELEAEAIARVIDAAGFCIAGQTGDIVPADKILYGLRDVTGTVPSIPLISASIMSKKLAEGINGLVLDVKTGSGAFMKTVEAARDLALHMIGIGEGMGCATRALITDMSQPLGRAVGNANEVAEAIAAMRGEGPPDLVEITCALGAEMLLLGDVVDTRDEGLAQIAEVLSNGRALSHFARFVEGQGGDARVVDDPEGVLPRAPHTRVVTARRGGYASAFDCAEIGRACGLLGGGRARAEDAIDPGVGLTCHVSLGDAVEVGTPLFTMSYRTAEQAEAATRVLEAATHLEDEPPSPRPLIFEHLSAQHLA